jgi:serine/threonine protein kinase
VEDSGNFPGGPGRRFGRYVLLEAIDRGGMAEVYRAVTQGPGGFQRQFVIKRIRKEKAASRDFVEMFVNEARISALLEHPNIVQVYDFGQVEGDYFLAMEYLRGRNLLAVSRRIRKEGQHPAPDMIAYVAREVARGLHYAHTLSNMGEPLGIVHRDVSPSNIMMLRTGGVKLLDFGIARATMKLRSLTPIGGLIKGKLAYLSPEQVRGQGVDGRADIFSLGVVMWEALTGLRLFFHPNDLDTMRNVLHRPVPRPSDMRPGVPAAIDAVILRALEREPDKRYPDAGAMAADLEDHLRESRFSPESVVTLLSDLFGGEDTARELPLPEEPGLAVRHATGGRNQISSGSLAPPPVAPMERMPAPAPEDVGYATESAIHRLAARATQQRRRRIVQTSAIASAGAGLAGLLVFSLMGHPVRPATTPVAAPALVSAIERPVAHALDRVGGGSAAAPSSGVAAIVAPAVPGVAPVAAEVIVAREPAPTARLGAPSPRAARAGSKDAGETRAKRTVTSLPSAPAAVDTPRGKRALASGLSALESGEYMRAVAQLEEVAQASPHNHEALGALAEAEFELARYAFAVSHARRAAALSPRNGRYQALLGDSLFKLRRFREASRAYAAAMAASPNEPAYRERKARADHLTGSPAEVQIDGE